MPTFLILANRAEYHFFHRLCIYQDRATEHLRPNSRKKKSCSPIQCMTASYCEDVSCPEGFSVRSPGSWQGGSWVSAAVWIVLDTFARSCRDVLWCSFVAMQDLLIHWHISCLPQRGCLLIGADFSGCFVRFWVCLVCAVFRLSA